MLNLNLIFALSDTMKSAIVTNIQQACSFFAISKYSYIKKTSDTEGEIRFTKISVTKKNIQAERQSLGNAIRNLQA
jgi:hypothetical protein